MRKIFLAAMLFISTMAFAQVAKQPCPTVTVIAPYEVQPGDVLIFTADITTDLNIKYNWTISNGTITSGQGTASISVDTKGLNGQFITATVEISGLQADCSASSSASASVAEGPKAMMLVSGKYTNDADFSGNMKLMVESLLLPANDEGTFQFLLSPGENSKPKEIEAIKKNVIKTFATLKIAPSRYKIVDDKKSTATSYVLWYIPKGATIPENSNNY